MDNSIEMEIKLLGIYMATPDLFSYVNHLVSTNIFTTPVTKKSYEIIKHFHEKGITPDMYLIYTALVKSGIPKDECNIVSKFDNCLFLSETAITEYVLLLFEKSIAKFLLPKLHAAINNFENGSPMDEMIKIKDAITKIELVLNNVSKEKSIKFQFKEAVERIKNLKIGVIERSGFSWGLPSLDEKTLGIVQGINIVAADKGGGKSSMLINIIVQNAIIDKIPILFFSMEMTAIEVLTNIISNVKRINSMSLRTGNIDDEELIEIEGLENKLNDSFVIDETGGISWQYFETKVRAHRKNHKIPANQTMLVLLDYLGLMKNSSDESKMSKEERIEQICTELMRICKNENIALVKLAQFSREGNRRGNDTFNIKNDSDKLKALRPRMSDLKGSAAIESNAVTILLLYRPEYYGILESGNMDFRGLCEINIAKGRYVSPKPVYVNFSGKYSLFEDKQEDPNDIKTSAVDEF